MAWERMSVSWVDARRFSNGASYLVSLGKRVAGSELILRKFGGRLNSKIHYVYAR